MSDSINYGSLMHQAMRGLLANVLRGVAETGLPGQHHFFITFDTQAEGVVIPRWLSERYPEEMTVVMQEWFANLEVTDEAFSVTLNFGNDEVSLTIPFDSIRTFVDPSVEFGLRFEASEEGEAVVDDEESPMIVIEEEAEGEDSHEDAEIVSLDSFRK